MICLSPQINDKICSNGENAQAASLHCIANSCTVFLLLNSITIWNEVSQAEGD